MTFHDELLQRVLATQQALPSVPATRVYAERQAPIEQAECPGIVVSIEGGRREAVLGSDGLWDLLRVACRIKLSVHTRGEPQTTLADPTTAEAHRALLADPSLGGVAMRLQWLDSQRRSAAADGTAGIYELTYEATVVVDERTLGLRTL